MCENAKLKELANTLRETGRPIKEVPDTRLKNAHEAAVKCLGKAEEDNYYII